MPVSGGRAGWRRARGTEFAPPTRCTFGVRETSTIYPRPPYHPLRQHYVLPRRRRRLFAEVTTCPDPKMGGQVVCGLVVPTARL